MPLSTASIFTVAPGITAPAESVTVPRMLPELVFCATAAKAGHNKARPRLARIHCFILPPGKKPSACAAPACFVGLRFSFLHQAAAFTPALSPRVPAHGRDGPQIVSPVRLSLASWRKSIFSSFPCLALSERDNGLPSLLVRMVSGDRCR